MALTPRRRFALMGCMTLLVGGVVLTVIFSPPVPDGFEMEGCSGSEKSFGAPHALQSCLKHWKEGRTLDVQNFSVSNFVREYECALTNRRVFLSNGIPDHDLKGTGPFPPCEVNWAIEVPLSPSAGAHVTEPAPQGIIGVATNGVPIYGANEEDMPPTNAVEPPQGSGLTGSKPQGHSSSRYHHHYHHPYLGHDSKPESTTLLGYALDGYPIYGPLDDPSSLDDCNFVEEGSSGRYHVRLLSQVNEDANYCRHSNPEVRWRYVVGCFHGDLGENTRVTSFGDLDASSDNPSNSSLVTDDCTLVHSSGTPNLSSGHKNYPEPPLSLFSILLIVAASLVGCALLSSGGYVCHKRHQQYSLASQHDVFELDEEDFEYDPDEEVDPGDVELAAMDIEGDEL
uniref:YHYH domain-containing protein n=1 Tax=Rhizochromulina marina TaxID=1034831 RepID=A0A7S2SL57_9STRA|mmetsp:Transcript_31450/g.91470  ORF Transcript_31450/g.91470 Transcript_31450/m.91470 type:complete len:397 (+) Transcript_31450:211-1401(+)|eukprot:CAMPEP_0118974702 /NCGR_PEP_ID=MMETSP1173-20130426/13064_1 /TAXON_ID=1034831 /ORGANISM="Rhizochromulina marina cf, Strain CCMP1243" /LENGTH=396 /DNA_ID=CAMNT_0006924489 /DNA_START=185 /DNA_END=1375 /DNA_ORIENTATION=-